MKVLVLAAALIAAAAVAVPAEAAGKKKSKRVVAPQQQQTMIAREADVVRAADGEVLGQDPDPFIRMMIRKEGRIRDQSGI